MAKGERFCGSGVGMNDTVYRVICEVKKVFCGSDGGKNPGGG